MMSDGGKWWAIEKFCKEGRVTAPPEPEPGDEWLFAEHAFHERDRAYSRTALSWWGRIWAEVRIFSVTAARLFLWTASKGNHWKCELEKDLRFAYETNALIPDRAARIAGRNRSNYRTTINELRTGRWLRSAGLPPVRWDPPATNGKRGDILVRAPSGPMFVEVKTVSGDRGSVVADRVDACLTRALHRKLTLPADIRCIVDVQIGGESSSPVDVPSVVSAAKRLANRASATRCSCVESLPFDEVTIRIEAEVSEHGGAFHVMHGGFMEHELQIRHVLERVQHPSGNEPLLVVVYDEEWWFVDFEKCRGIDSFMDAHMLELTSPTTRGDAAIDDSIDGLVLLAHQYVSSSSRVETRAVLYHRDSARGIVIKDALASAVASVAVS